MESYVASSYFDRLPNELLCPIIMQLRDFDALTNFVKAYPSTLILLRKLLPKIARSLSDQADLPDIKGLKVTAMIWQHECRVLGGEVRELVASSQPALLAGCSDRLPHHNDVQGMIAVIQKIAVVFQEAKEEEAQRETTREARKARMRSIHADVDALTTVDPGMDAHQEDQTQDRMMKLHKIRSEQATKDHRVERPNIISSIP
ncbi:MAG: hypothetical protein Q9181_002787 [Wetmoreana brouardii]